MALNLLELWLHFVGIQTDVGRYVMQLPNSAFDECTEEGLSSGERANLLGTGATVGTGWKVTAIDDHNLHLYRDLGDVPSRASLSAHVFEGSQHAVLVLESSFAKVHFIQLWRFPEVQQLDLLKPSVRDFLGAPPPPDAPEDDWLCMLDEARHIVCYPETWGRPFWEDRAPKYKVHYVWNGNTFKKRLVPFKR